MASNKTDKELVAKLKKVQQIIKDTDCKATTACADVGVLPQQYYTWTHHRRTRARKKQEYASSAKVLTTDSGNKVAVFYGTPAQIAKIFAKLK